MTRYGLLDRTTGLLVRLQTELEGTIYGTSYRLAREDFLPIYTVSSPEIISELLSHEPLAYSSSAEKPGWGTFQPEDLQPVEITVEVRVNPTDIVPIKQMAVSDVRKIPPTVAARYLNRPKLPVGSYYFSVFDTTKEGQSRTEIEGLTGKTICTSGFYDKYLLAGVADVPEDLVGQGGYSDTAALAILQPQEYRPRAPTSDENTFILAGLKV